MLLLARFCFAVMAQYSYIQRLPSLEYVPEFCVISASFIFTLHLAEKWQRHPAADLRGYKPLLQFTIFSSNKSVNYFYLKMKNAVYLWYLFTNPLHQISERMAF
ncbi:MAG: hypothetical protein B1H11_12330 [Desulfobacteraceae bacterium 4484_190.1]|nr:MAG: hypothetical protein B1H11_12330 [Desulfobacteraceae bacterium 4484_190.1]